MSCHILLINIYLNLGLGCSIQSVMNWKLEAQQKSNRKSIEKSVIIKEVVHKLDRKT